MPELPSKYDHSTAEETWSQTWEEWGVHRWDDSLPREDTFVVDTPPPTVSGSLHIGHVFSYTHQDLIVRYQRMRGKNIHYAMGWDDNGLPTERRVQNIFGIRCDPKLPHDPQWTPTRDKGKKDPVEEVSRQNFIDACAIVTEEDEKAFEDLWRRLGLSVDWSHTYATIDPHCRKISQQSFLDLVKKGEVYQAKAPTMWDVDFKTAVAQAEVEDREKPGLMHEIRFGLEDGGEFKISTTRPELLPACIAVVAHPDDERYQPLFGKYAITPLFHAKVPILPAEHAEPDKGTGILMVCTFGDSMDVEWWKQSDLPLKQVIGMDGRLAPVEYGEEAFQSLDAASAQKTYDELAGLYPNQAKKKMAELLVADGSGPGGDGAAMVSEPEQIQHPVKFYEKGDRPLEFVPTRQWFIRILDHKDDLVGQGQKIKWHPEFMYKRYAIWVEGLNQDWCVSRQRYFGVPFPVWYPVNGDGSINYEDPIYGEDSALPLDPLTDVAPGFSGEQRDQPGGFTGDPDVMDTWATSSLTPQIQSHWSVDDSRHAKLFPMDIRPQSHEIIRTWAFYTIVKAWMHDGEIPWNHVVISGWILDPDRKKMSKSKGNVVTPGHLLEQHSVDGVRYWAGRARLGSDTAFDETVFKVGKKLATKVFNASRFVFMQVDSATGEGPSPGMDRITDPLDIAMIDRLRTIVTQTTNSFEKFDYSGALQGAEEGFWEFCDHYLELVKNRSYADEDSPGRQSAIATLNFGIGTFLRLLAPFLPYVTEEAWSWRLSGDGRDRSIHTTSWPTLEECSQVAAGNPDTFDAAVEVLSKIRGTKSEAQKSLKWPVSALEITAPADSIAALEPVLDDILLAGCVDEGACTCSEGSPPEGERFAVTVTLGEQKEE